MKDVNENEHIGLITAATTKIYHFWRPSNPIHCTVDDIIIDFTESRFLWYLVESLFQAAPLEVRDKTTFRNDSEPDRIAFRLRMPGKRCRYLAPTSPDSPQPGADSVQ